MGVDTWEDLFAVRMKFGADPFRDIYDETSVGVHWRYSWTYRRWIAVGRAEYESRKRQGRTT